MASYEQHSKFAVVSSALASVTLFGSGILDTSEAVIAVMLGAVGGVLPDLDTQNSRPTKIFIQILCIFAPLLFIFSIGGSLPILHILLFWGLCASVLYFVYTRILAKSVVHRGVIHSIPCGIFCSLLVVVVFNKSFGYSISKAQIIGFFLFFGFISHLVLDELFSLVGLKKSLGTALKLYDKKNLIGTALLYIGCLALAFFQSFDYKVYMYIYESLKNIKFL